MRTHDFDFELPPERIALRPVDPRDSARLLIVRPDAESELRDQTFHDLLDELRPGDALVFNDTRVIPARLIGRRVGRGDTQPKIEATLLKQEEGGAWQAFVRPAKKLEVGDKVAFPGHADAAQEITASIVEKRARGEILLAFDECEIPFEDALLKTGFMPLPPYIAARRAPDHKDLTDYQTVYAAKSGAVAAPTAGLHFTGNLLSEIKAKGISSHFVTLHVGAGTFLPVQVEDLSKHKMHSEFGEITPQVADALNQVRARGGRIIAVGTTSARLLESAANDEAVLQPFSAETDIFISPGYKFKAIDMMLTNFHLPKSTLFMLVSAFSGLACMKQAYAHAVANEYRFYSYGDACLLYPESTRA